MSDPKQVLIFGSFTEDEARLFQGKSNEINKHEESVKLQFGSFEFVSVSLREGLGAQAKQIDSSGRVKVAKAPNLVTNEQVTKDEKTPASSAVQSKIVAQSNSSTHVCSPLSNGVLEKERKAPKVVINESACKDGRTLARNVVQSISVAQTNGSNSLCSILSKGVIKKDANSSTSDLMHISETRTSSPETLATPEVLYDGVEGSTNCDTLACSSSIPNVEPPKIPSDHAHHVKALLPRGLLNPGNLCFLNATLQGLLSCSPFVQLLQDLRTRNIPKIDYPTLHAFVEFISDFDMLNETSTKKNERGVMGTGKSLSPVMFAAVLQKFTPDLPNHLTGRPRQEDAQEFLSFVMDQMHYELLKLGGQLSSSNGKTLFLVSSADDDGWETVGRKNKSAVTRTQSFMPSELSAIFGGQLRSVVKARGNKPSATVQPFLLLHLDIYPEVVNSVEDALHLFSAPETLDGYRTSAGKAGLVTASKSLMIQTLPKIMILHLMRFSYGSKGSTKLHKPISFPLELILGRELLVSPSTEGRKYELVGTITHHGREPSKGHYTADTRYSDGQWLRYDDANVMAVGVNKVLHCHAYLLFYKQV